MGDSSAWWFFGIWFVGLFLAGCLNVGARSENGRILRARRVAFAFVLAIQLLLVTSIYVGANTNFQGGLWWVIALGCGLPIAVASGVAVRDAYAGHRVVLVVAVVAAAALYLAFPLGFVPPGRALTGLGRFLHDHRPLDTLALFVPTLILLASEALRGRIAADSDSPSFFALLRRTPRRVIVGSAITVVVVLAFEGLSGPFALYAGGLAVVGVVAFLWLRTRSAARRMRHDFE